MKAILIDDEQLALNYLEHLLINISDIQVVGKFIDPFMGKRAIETNDIDIVFLDIQIPEINGIQLAEQILEIKPSLSIIFVTAYDHYAIEAFELNALDYVLKPIQKERLLKTIQRIREKNGITEDSVLKKKENLQMCLFQQVSISNDNQQTIPIHWRTSKVQQLFLYLIHYRGRIVSKLELIELLWDGYEPKKAFSQLYTAIYHIRKTLEAFGDHFIVKNLSEGYILTLDHIQIDVDEFEYGIQSETTISKETIESFERAMDLYKGEYLQGYDYLWAEGERQRLQMLWIGTSLKMANWYFDNRFYEKAVKQCMMICNRHPLVEEAYFILIKTYAVTGNRLFVRESYRQLTEVVKKELNEDPSPTITEWYIQWCKKNRE